MRTKYLALQGHSVRIGAATSAVERGVCVIKIRTLRRCNSNAFKIYIRPHSKRTLNISNSITYIQSIFAWSSYIRCG